MEEWQREHIKGNLVDLLQTTIINPIVLITLRSERILTQGDINDLEEEEQKHGRASQILKFYAILQAKGNNAYEMLIQAFRNSSQNGAVRILESGSSSGPVPVVRKEESPLSALKENPTFIVQEEKPVSIAQEKKPTFSEQKKEPASEKTQIKVENEIGEMKKWQREHIAANLDILKTCTALGAPLYSQLISKGLLSTKDILSLETELNTGKKSQKFYEIMQTKGDKAYDTLIQVLRDSGQNGAVAVLEIGDPSTKSPIGEKNKFTFKSTRKEESTPPLSPIEKPALEKVQMIIDYEIGGMEKWQRQHIKANLDVLMDNTIPEATLYAQLIGKGLLNTRDILSLETEPNTRKKSQKFYEIMQRKEDNAYNKLIEAMDQCAMTGATAVLKKAKKPVLF